MEIKVKIEIKWDSKCLSGVTEDREFVEKLREDHKIIAGSIGSLKTISKQNKLMTNPFILNKFEVKYLKDKYIFIKQLKHNQRAKL
jgi:hypothetical protein